MTQLPLLASVVQCAKHLTGNQSVTGSFPVGDLDFFCVLQFE